MNNRISLSVLACVALAVCMCSASAETIELKNGDKFSGKVISVDATNVILENEILGRVKIPRAKIVAIFLGEQASRPETKDFPKPDKNPDEVIKRVLESAGKFSPDSIKGKGSKTPADVVRELQTKGIDPQELSGIYQKLPLLAVPGVKKYFNDKVTGLASGRLNLQDIRKDAVKARDGLKDLQKDLGPDGKALEGYLSILNAFIDQTTPPKNDKAPMKK